MKSSSSNEPDIHIPFKEWRVTGTPVAGVVGEGEFLPMARG